MQEIRAGECWILKKNVLYDLYLQAKKETKFGLKLITNNLKWTAALPLDRYATAFSFNRRTIRQLQRFPGVADNIEIIQGCIKFRIVLKIKVSVAVGKSIEWNWKVDIFREIKACKSQGKENLRMYLG